jgi:phosphatidate phosphatase APP1
MADDPNGSQRGWRDLAFRIAFGVERGVDAVQARRRRARGDARVVPYLGFGDGRAVRLRGRVLRDRPVDPADPSDGPFANLAAAWRRFASAEIAGATVLARLETGGAVVEHRLVADGEGFLDARIQLDPPVPPGRLPVRFEVLDPAPETPETAAGEVVVAPPDAPFGVISDIDDTVLVSDATNAAKVLARTLLQNVHERLAFPGVAELYRSLAASGAPFFYVSSSPWNLHGPLTRFLELHELPAGPLLLRDWGLDEASARGHAGHKSSAIASVLEALPELRFLLIGDSGQEDPEIYARLVEERPERVLGVLIRDVAGPTRDAAVDDLARTAEARGVPFRRVADSAEAARVCREHGWTRAADERAATDATPPTDGAPGRG